MNLLKSDSKMMNLENNSEGILNAAREASSSLLPVKSKERYEKVYEMFCEWRNTKKVKGFDENLTLAYFYEKAKVLKASSLWSSYYMLKSTIQINENIDISQYKKLIAFLKRQNDGYQPKKSKVLTMENVTKFLSEAPDDAFLLTKVVLIFGLNGACRRAELCNLTVEDIEDTGTMLVITLHDTKTNKKRVFTVGSECNGYEIYCKYMRLRPKTVKHQRFFLFYHNGKCTVQPVGIHSFAKMPQKIAEYLKLPDASYYTGHCLRRTSVTFLADRGVDIQVLKRHGGWKSTSVAESYIEESIGNKIKTSKSIFKQAAEASTSVAESHVEESIGNKTESSKSIFKQAVEALQQDHSEIVVDQESFNKHQLIDAVRSGVFLI